MKQKTLLTIAVLMGLITIISCEEETDLKHNTQNSTSISGKETGTAFISNGFLKEKLIQHAYEAYATWYEVELTQGNTKVIDEEVLHGWIKANEKNKHETINQKNRDALAAMAEQGNVYALLVTAPAGSKFQKSVFVLGRFTAILITDVIDITDTFWPRLIKEGVGFYGNGVLDPWGNFQCACVEEYRILIPGETYSKCGRCPDLGDL